MIDKIINRIIAKVNYLKEKEFFRFLVVGGVNTILGYIVTLFLFYILKLDYRLSQMLNFVLCFPVAYTLQVKYAFCTKWCLKRLFVYPIASLPNFGLQLLTLMICVDFFRLPEYIAYLISYVVPIPIMFLVVKFLVSPKNPGKKVP